MSHKCSTKTTHALASTKRESHPRFCGVLEGSHDFLGLDAFPLKSYGGHSEGEIPGPIPNPEVKPFSADGTAVERLWESRTPPDIL